MKNRILIVSSILLVSIFFACGKEGGDHHEGGEHSMEHSMDGHEHDKDGHSMKPQYKAVEAGDLKASFEFSTMGDHIKSMKKMGMSMKMDHKNMGDHHVMVTLLNKSDGKINMDVKEMTLSVTGPDGKTVTKKAHVMHKDNMHHFGADFSATGKGTYKIKAAFQYNGKSYSPEAEFTM